MASKKTTKQQTKKEAKQIVEMGYRVRAKIEGLVPAMFDQFYNIEDTDGPAKVKPKSTWKQDLVKKIYVDKKGVYVPVDNIRMMLIGNQHRTGSATILGSRMEKNKGKPYKEFCDACVWVVGPDDPRRVYFEPRRKTFDEYDERSFINKTGGRGITRRPLVMTPWSVTFFVDVTENQYDVSKILQFFQIAGRRCGLGAYGPTFGRFRVAQWEVVE